MQLTVEPTAATQRRSEVERLGHEASARIISGRRPSRSIQA
jgi:hypothetical protein